MISFKWKGEKFNDEIFYDCEIVFLDYENDRKN